MERYEIIITEKGKKTESNVAGQEGSTTTTNVAGQDEKKIEDVKSTSGALVSVMAKTMLNEAQTLIVPRIGEFTRDSLFQQQIDSAIGLGDTVAAFAVNPVLGAVTVAMDGLTNVIDYAYEDKWNRIKSEQAVARSGGKGGYRR